MKFTQRTRGIVQAIAVVLSLALPLMLAISSADARIGGGGSSGSRGTRTFSAPPSTSTAPSAAQPFNRTMTQPGSPGVGAPAAAGGGFFNRPGMGMLGGLAAGFLGAGLLGMLFGGGMFSGLGGLSSIFGLILQIGLIVIVVRLAMSWWQRRHATASAYAGAAPGAATSPGASSSFRTGTGFGLGSGSAPLEILPADYEAFERLLSEIQAAWSNEDVAKLHTLATPEMVSYFTGDLAANKARNVVNKVSDTKLLQGDLAEAWREGETDFASVAMRFSLVDKTIDRTTGRLVEGSDQPTEATEVWTFLRPRGANWELSAIQQA
jgi:predicted lipid-binding transport protein (Tim44 family)